VKYRHVLLLPVLSMLLCGCSGGSGPRKPTSAERAGILAGVRSTWSFFADFAPFVWDRSLRGRYPNFRQRRLRPKVVSIRVSRSVPRLASAAVEVVDRHGRPTPNSAVLLFGKQGRSWELVDGPATSFPNSCGAAVARAVRSLLCPNPWSVLGYKPRRARTGETSASVAGGRR
jgi:hypothetical protein